MMCEREATACLLAGVLSLRVSAKGLCSLQQSSELLRWPHSLLVIAYIHTYDYTHSSSSSSIAMSAEAREGLTDEQVADLKEAFAMFDINGDGKCRTMSR